MKKNTLLALAFMTCAAPLFAGADFVITKVEVNAINSPEYQVTVPIHQSRAQKWIEAEVTFDAAPEMTPELTFNYYFLIGKHVFVGHVTHVAIAKGRELHSVVYISPKSFSQAIPGQSADTSAVSNVTVTISKPGAAAIIAAGSLHSVTTAWWNGLKQEEGLVNNKNETPFMPLYWDRYEAIKAAPAR